MDINTWYRQGILWFMNSSWNYRLHALSNMDYKLIMFKVQTNSLLISSN